MVRLNMNLDEISDGFEVIPAGEYTAKVVDIEEKDSSKGNPMLEWTWSITDGSSAGSEVKSFTSLQEHARFGLKEHLTAFGLKGEVDFDTDRLLKKKAKLLIGVSTVKSRNTGEDMEVNRVEKILPAKSSKPKTAEIDDDDGDDDLPF